MAQSAPAPLRAAPTTTPERELKIHISTRSFGWWEYEGTRAQLEAEGIIPAGTEWPQGKNILYWDQGRLRFRLCRIRPEGSKGPMATWVNGDCWCLRCETTDDSFGMGWRIKQKARELAQAIYDVSPEGRRERDARWARYWVAQKDTAFQAFKNALIPQSKKPGRPAKPRTTPSNLQGAQP